MTPKGDVVRLVLESLTRLRLEPVLVPHGRVDELRGGVSCIDLKAGGGVDAAIVPSTMSLGAIEGSRALYKIDYAVRGNIKGVLSGRIITRTIFRTKGVIKARVEKVRWEVPQSESNTLGSYQLPLGEGVRPGPGEVWKGGPHEELTRSLNEDAELAHFIRSFMDSKKSAPMTISVVSDAWNESLRITGGLWLRTQELEKVYASQDYTRVVDRIGQHIKVVRRRFGGLTL